MGSSPLLLGGIKNLKLCRIKFLISFQVSSFKLFLVKLRYIKWEPTFKRKYPF